MTPAPTPAAGQRRRAECPVCGRVFLVRLDGKLRRHQQFHAPSYPAVCVGSYVDTTGEGAAT